MSETYCRYFEDDRWKERVWDEVKQWEIGSFLSETVGDREKERVLETLAADRTELTAEQDTDSAKYAGSVPIAKAERIGGLDISRREYVDSWQEHVFAGPALDEHLYDLECPHDVVRRDGSTEEYCLFHLSPKRLDELDIAQKEESRRLQEAIASAESATRKQFIGSRFRQFGAAYTVYKSDNRHPVDLRFSTIEEVEATDIEFADGLLLSHSIFDGVVQFQNAVFHAVNAKYARFEDEVKFNRAEFAGDATFTGASFGRTVTFNHATFDRRATFNDAAFDEQVKFTQVRFRKNAYFMRVLFDHKAIFTGTVFEDDAFFYKAVFGKANFSGATFDGNVTLEFGEFRGRCSFDGATVREGIQFAPVSTDTTVKFTDATVDDGFIRQPKTGVTNYRFERARLGEVDLEPKADPDLFQHCTFENTEFDGFRFSDHLDALSSNWNLHRGHGDGPQETTIRQPRAWANALVKQNKQLYATIESTYLRAKNGAEQTGDSKIAQEFFLRERKYRRKKQANIATNGATRGALDVLVRLRATAGWVTSWFYNLTCGYGERPLRTVISSGALIGVFAFVYMALGTPVPGGESPLGYLSFSVQTFVTLLIGPVPDTYPVHTRLLTGLEAFAGAFFIALFVFALTRSIKR